MKKTEIRHVSSGLKMLKIQTAIRGYRFKVVLFGASCSPFLLNATIRKHLESAEEDTNKLARGLYVDNLQGSSDDEAKLLAGISTSL